MFQTVRPQTVRGGSGPHGALLRKAPIPHPVLKMKRIGRRGPLNVEELLERPADRPAPVSLSGVSIPGGTFTASRRSLWLLNRARWHR